MQCYKHAKVETFLSCGRCEKPICPDCVVQGPAGIRCRECASVNANRLYKVPPIRLVWSGLVAVVAGSVGLVAVNNVPVFGVALAYFYGRLLADTVMRASGMRAGWMIKAFAVGGIVCGAAARVLFDIFYYDQTLRESVLDLWAILQFAVALYGCYTRIKDW